jgi:hypothetical protein
MVNAKTGSKKNKARKRFRKQWSFFNLSEFLKMRKQGGMPGGIAGLRIFLNPTVAP